MSKEIIMVVRAISVTAHKKILEIACAHRMFAVESKCEGQHFAQIICAHTGEIQRTNGIFLPLLRNEF
jgi:hypothetical protein